MQKAVRPYSGHIPDLLEGSLLRAFSALFCLVIGLTPAAGSDLQTRVLSGQVAVLERLALPDDSMLIVDLTTADDVPVTGLRSLTDGGQSPFDFTVEAPSEVPLVLRVGLRAMDERFWLSEPVLIPAGEGDVNLGVLRAPRIPAMGLTGLLACGTQLVEIGFLPDTVRFRLNEQAITLHQQVSASGVLYVDQDNPATSLHMKGDSGVLRIDGAELSECTLTRPEQDITFGVWNISALEDTPALFPSRTELVFYPDGRMVASVGCNRLIGGYRRHGGILLVERLASTRMACPEGLSEQEAKFNAILPKVDGYTMDHEAGRLTLTSGGQSVLRARR